MSHINVKSEQVIDASPEEVYAALKDYKQKRPQILPPNFVDYAVEKGGVGTGTVVDYRLKAGGRERPYKMQVDETIKGKVITERDTNSSLVTRWSLLPLKEGKQTQVSVITEWEGGSGIGGFFERTFAPMGLRRIYGSMLSKLASLLQNEGQSASGKNQSGSSATNIGMFLLVAAIVLGIAIGLSYLRKVRE
ncbi:MAG TPA: SRPBCC family protein [Ktedonobacteraceae bacterium]|jgi:hypothetical protein|nr:SRPBCC family protein [Ktedonobacteraceae bacterium]